MDWQKEMDEVADYIESRTEFGAEEARDALRRGYTYFKDCGHPDQTAWDKAALLVSLAAYKDRDWGFGLRGTVDHLLFGTKHRIQTGCEL